VTQRALTFEAINVALSIRKAVAVGIVHTVAKVLVIGAPVSYALGRAYADGYWRAEGDWGEQHAHLVRVEKP